MDSIQISQILTHHCRAWLPEFAAKIDDFPNIFIHFSLDKDSLARRSQFLKRAPRSRNYFFSYQCEPEEVPSGHNLAEISVVFFDNYVPACDLKRLPPEIVCPLNGKADIRDTCVNCRWCFNGGAVKLWGDKTDQFASSPFNTISEA
jgi:hypothetical protein